MKFRKPDFGNRNLELRFENEVVCIYGTVAGLKRLGELCNRLIENPAQGHIHLEDAPNFLTDESEKGAIAIFEGK